MDRLQKVLAHAGVASRRAAEKLIEEGRVTVNGRTVDRLGTRVDPGRDSIKVDGKRIAPPRASHAYLLLHKPDGYVTTLSDPQGRPTVADLVRDHRARVYPVGRLDYHSEGLLILTDDGDLARALSHPSSEVPKTYLVKTRGEPSPRTLSRLRGGVLLDGQAAVPARVRLARPGSNAWLEITLKEGRNRQIRRMCREVGHPVLKLRRVAYAGIGLGRLAAGRWRRLTPGEVDRLRSAAGLPLPGRRRGHRP